MSKITKAARTMKSVIGSSREEAEAAAADAATKGAGADAAAQDNHARDLFAGRTGLGDNEDTAQDDPFGADLGATPSTGTGETDGAGLIPGTEAGDVVGKSNSGRAGSILDEATGPITDNSSSGGVTPNLKDGGSGDNPVVDTTLVDRDTSPKIVETHQDGSQTVNETDSSIIEANNRALADGRPITDAATGDQSSAVDLNHPDMSGGSTDNYVSPGLLGTVFRAKGAHDGDNVTESQANKAADSVLDPPDNGTDQFFVDEFKLSGAGEFFPETNTDTTDPLDGPEISEEQANAAADEVLFEKELTDAEVDAAADEVLFDDADDDNSAKNTDENDDEEEQEQEEQEEEEEQEEQEEDTQAENESTDDGADDGTETGTSTPNPDDPTSEEALRNRAMLEEMGLLGDKRTRNDNLIDPDENEEIPDGGTGYVPPVGDPEQDMVTGGPSNSAGPNPTNPGNIDYGPDHVDNSGPGLETGTPLDDMPRTLQDPFAADAQNDANVVEKLQESLEPPTLVNVGTPQDHESDQPAGHQAVQLADDPAAKEIIQQADDSSDDAPITEDPIDEVDDGAQHNGSTGGSQGDVLEPLRAAELVAQAPAVEAAKVAAMAPAQMTVDTSVAEVAKMEFPAEVTPTLDTPTFEAPDMAASAIDAVGADLDIDSATSVFAEVVEVADVALDADDFDIAD